MRRRGLLLALALGLGLAAPHPASAAENGDFSLRPDRPASAEARDRSYIVKTVAPGAELTDRLLAVNLTDKPIELDVAPVDAGVADGAFAPGTTATAEGSWLTVTPGRVRVPAGGTARVDVRIRVPATATAGDHIAAVVAQRAGGGGEQRGNVRLVQRVGVRVYLTVQPTGESSRVGTLDRRFELRDLRWAGDAFEVDVANTGDLLVEPLGTVSVSRGGLGASAEVPVLGTVLPGQVTTFRVPPPGDLEPGTYEGKVRLRLVQGGGEQEKGVTFTLDGALKAADQPSPTPAKRRMPWLLVVLALAALVGVAVEARRRLTA